jgi:phospholipid-binding lipoprotein MlaA
LLLAAILAGCATPPTDPADRAAFEQTNDPLEPMNRKIFDFNLFVDRILIKPVTKVYIAIVPEQGRDAVHHALENMKEPVVFINDVLQAQPKRAGITVGRFVVNSTLGIAGLLDPATKWGLDKETGDFGQTLYVWGLPNGPYLVVPILGPSNPRDLVGKAADAYIDPIGYLARARDLNGLSVTRFVLGGADERAQVMDVLDDLERNSLDYYAQLRSLVQQHRAAELSGGKAPEPAANFYDDPGKTPAASPSTAAPSPPRGPTPAAPPKAAPKAAPAARPASARP